MKVSKELRNLRDELKAQGKTLKGEAEAIDRQGFYLERLAHSIKESFEVFMERQRTTQTQIALLSATLREMSVDVDKWDVEESKVLDIMLEQREQEEKEMEAEVEG